MALLDEPAAWVGANPGFGLSRYAYPLIHLDHFFAVGFTLWPQLLKHHGGVLLAEEFSVSRFDNWLNQTGDLTSIERVMNHRHMRYMLASLNDAPWPILLSAAGLISDCWKAQIHQLFPDVQIRVEISQSDVDVEVTFFTVGSNAPLLKAVQNP